MIPAGEEVAGAAVVVSVVASPAMLLIVITVCVTLLLFSVVAAATAAGATAVSEISITVILFVVSRCIGFNSSMWKKVASLRGSSKRWSARLALYEIFSVVDDMVVVVVVDISVVEVEVCVVLLVDTSCVVAASDSSADFPVRLKLF